MSDNTLKHINLRSEEVQEILDKVPHWMIRWGNLLFLSLILMVLGISWFVKYPDILPSEAVITTQLAPQKEFAKTSGKIMALLVEDYQEVHIDQPLAILENTANYEDVYMLKKIIDTITINNKGFYFPVEKLPLLFLGDIESQYALFENSYIQYNLNKDYQPFSNESLANEFSLSELKGRLESLKLQRSIKKSELDYILKDLNRQKVLFEKGVISEQEFERQQLRYEQEKRSYKNFDNSISQLKESISGAHMKSKGTEINKVKEEMTLLKSVIQTFNQLKKAIKDWELRYVLKSNINGKVSFLNYWNTNQSVEQGDLMFTIIPNENSAFVAKLKTPSQNSGKIKEGQTVYIKLENYPDAEFGVLEGTVKHISMIPDDDGIYYVEVLLPKKLVTSYGKAIEFKQEMRGIAEIVTEDLRLLERLFYQFKEVFKRN